MSFGEHIGAQQQHSSGFSFAERLTETAGVAADQVRLKLSKAVGGNTHVGQLAKASVDAVNGLPSFKDGLDHLATLGYASDGFCVEGY